MKLVERLVAPSIIVVAICAVTLTGFNVQATYRQRHPPLPMPQFVVPDWHGYAKGERFGAEKAKVTMVLFTDYQCPACRALEKELMQIGSNDLAVVIRHFPLNGHTYAEPAARAAVCAGQQARFREIHEALFAASDTIDRVSFPRLASQVGVADTAEFKVCLDSDATRLAVANDLSDGKKLGIVATPTFLLNGDQYVGTTALRLLYEKKLEEVVKQKI